MNGDLGVAAWPGPWPRLVLLVAVFVSLAAAGAAVCPAAAADLALSAETGYPTQTVTSELTITNVGGLAIESLDIEVTYDPAVLTFLAGRNGTALEGGAFPPTEPILNDVGGTILIAGTTLLAGVTPPEGGVIFELDFQIRSDATPGVTVQELPEVRINESVTFTSQGGAPNAAAGTVTVQVPTPPPVFGISVTPLVPSAADLQVDWAAAGCFGDVDHQIIYGYRSDLPATPGGTYTPAGSECLIGAGPYNWIGSPDPALDPDRLLWFLVLATDGSVAEGSWGPDGLAAERGGPGAGGSSGECAITMKDLSNTCP